MKDKLHIIGAVVIVACLVMGSVAYGFYGVEEAETKDININVGEGGVVNIYEGGEGDGALGGSTSDDWNVGGNLSVTGTSAFTGATTFTGGIISNGGITGVGATVARAETAFATTTLAATDSGKTYFLSASGTSMILPAVSAGLNFRFIVNGAIDTTNYQILSAEGDNMEGTLIVAGAVVDCDAEDQINIIADGENLGDYFEVSSDGSQWLIGDSGALTSGKMTCTDPS